MNHDTVTFEQLDRVLGQLGFSRQMAPPNRVWYEHAASDTIIIVADQKLGDSVRKPDWISARIHLIEKGLVSADGLDEMLFPRPCVPTTPTVKQGKRR